MAKSSTPPKPTQQPAPLTSPQRLTPVSPSRPKKAARLQETIQRLSMVTTRRLARQGGLTPEPEPVTLQPSPPCPEVLSPQVTARRVGPPPTAVSPPSPMQLDKSANSSTSSRIDSSGKSIDTHRYAPDNITSSAEVNVQIRCMQRFMGKGWKHKKILYCKATTGYFIMLTRPNRDHCVIFYRPTATMATVFKGPDSKYHMPDFHCDHTNFLNEHSHNACKRSLPVSREVIIRDLANTPLYRAYPKDY